MHAWACILSLTGFCLVSNAWVDTNARDRLVAGTAPALATFALALLRVTGRCYNGVTHFALAYPIALSQLLSLLQSSYRFALVGCCCDAAACRLDPALFAPSQCGAACSLHGVRLQHFVGSLFSSSALALLQWLEDTRDHQPTAFVVQYNPSEMRVHVTDAVRGTHD
ncbi:hypothetical protein SDRG_04241 [Saprolegnia diclina VS20]|uniref:Uncharacterized protein n=1 Tax=Saprolegnia diclina (strain VS20) TaxID=1156394 RepID=T0QWZ4_SAPDV|nr:hypothetical protein SDRG_04241 [Saprolegnia diclina VS20]EQC38535.1 hypothetical protein SDRG_04241 [Saprolegnia diclina VS20]|eukprot:XP_008608127.1 hypothetical protein SDRG_04241 [Saprolegnia diclina VS20]